MFKTEAGDAEMRRLKIGPKEQSAGGFPAQNGPAAEASWPQTDSIFAPRNQTFGAKTSLSAECRSF